MEHGRHSMAWAEKSGALPRIANAAFTLALPCVQTGRLGELLELAPRIVEIIRLVEANGSVSETFGAPYPPCITLAAALGWGYALMGRRSDAEPLLAQAVSIALEAQHKYALALAHAYSGWSLSPYRDGAACLEHGQEALRIARENRFAAMEMMAGSVVGSGQLYQGRINEAIRSLEEALSLSRKLGYHSFRSNTYCALAEAHLEDGAIDRAAELCAEGLRFSAETGERKLDPELHRLSADSSNDLDAVERHLRTSLALSEQFGTRVLVPRAQLSLGRLQARRGAGDEARVLFLAARDEARAMGLMQTAAEADAELPA